MHTQQPHASQEQPAIIRKLCARAQCRFSAFFHGQSVLTKERYGSPISKSKGFQPCRSRVFVARSETNRHGSAPRSRTSTFSLIDPISSPLSSPTSYHNEESWHYRGTFFRPVPTLRAATRPITQGTTHLSNLDNEPFRGRVPARTRVRKRYALSAIKDRQIKHKTIGSLISGILLILLLTICEQWGVRLEDATDCLRRSWIGNFRLGLWSKISRGLHCFHPVGYDDILSLLDPIVHA